MTTQPRTVVTEMFYSEAHHTWAVRYLTDDKPQGIAQGSEFLIALTDKDATK